MIGLFLASCVFIEDRRTCEADVETTMARSGLVFNDQLCDYDFPDDLCEPDEPWDNTTTVAFPFTGLYEFDTRGSPIQAFFRVESCDDEQVLSCQPQEDVTQLFIEAGTVLHVSLNSPGTCGFVSGTIDLIEEVQDTPQGPDLDVVFGENDVRFIVTSEAFDDWSLGIADLPSNWFGEDCFEPLYCHDFATSLDLDTVSTIEEVVLGSTTLLTGADSPTYILRHNPTGDCWTGGAFPETYVDQGCDPLPLEACESDAWVGTGIEAAVGSTCGKVNHRTTGCGGTGEDIAYRWTAPYTAEWTFDLTSSYHDTVLGLHESCPSTRALLCNDDTDTRGSRVRQQVDEGETIVVQVESFQGCGDYILDIYEAGAPAQNCSDPDPPNETKADAWLLPEGTNELVMSGYEDWFLVDQPANSICSWEVSGQPDLDVAFVFNNGIDFFPGVGRRVEHTGPADTAHIRVRRTSPIADCAPYTLTASCGPL